MENNSNFGTEITHISRAVPVKAKGSGNYGPPCVYVNTAGMTMS